MKSWILLLAVISAIAPAVANDGGGEAIGGSWEPLAGEHKSIRMEREWLRFDAYQGHYEADITFYFRNLSRRAAKVQMGFPESGGGVDAGPDNKTKTAYRGFKTWVDRKPVATKRLPAKMASDDEGYSTYWVKTVWFRPQELKVIRVHYAAPYAEAIGEGTSILYGFTGGNWRGKVASTRLVLCLHTPGRWFGPATVTYGDQETPRRLPFRQKGRTLSTSWSNWEAQGDLSIGLNWMPLENWTGVVQGKVLRDSVVAVNLSYDPARWSSRKYWDSLVNVIVPGPANWHDLDLGGGTIPDFWRQNGTYYVSLDTLDKAHVHAARQERGSLCILTYYDKRTGTLRAVRLDEMRRTAQTLSLPCQEERINQVLATANWKQAKPVRAREPLILASHLPRDSDQRYVALRAVIGGLGGHVLFDPAHKRVGFWFDKQPE